MLQSDKLMPLTSLLLMAPYVRTPSHTFSYLYTFSFSSTWVIVNYFLMLNAIKKILCIELELTWPHVLVHFSMTSQAFLSVHNFFLTYVYFLRLPAHVPAKSTKCLCVFPQKMSTCISLENCVCNDWDGITYIWLPIMAVYFVTNLLSNLQFLKLLGVFV